jgi:hypothetical protein
MRNITIVALAIVILFGFGGCGPSRDEIRKEIEAEVTTKVLNDMKGEQADFVDYKKKKEKLNDMDVEAKPGETKLDALIRERQETKGEIAKTKQEITAKQKLIEEGEGKVKALDAAIKQAEQDRLKFWANLVGGISAGLAIVLAIAAFLTSGYPILPKVLRYAAIGFGALSALAFGFAAIVGYLTIIGISLGVIILGAGLFFWFKDRKSLTQVAEVVEKHKNEIPNYKEKFSQIIDSDVDEHVNKVRENIKKKFVK